MQNQDKNYIPTATDHILRARIFTILESFTEKYNIPIRFFGDTALYLAQKMGYGSLNTSYKFKYIEFNDLINKTICRQNILFYIEATNFESLENFFSKLNSSVTLISRTIFFDSYIIRYKVPPFGEIIMRCYSLKCKISDMISLEMQITAEYDPKKKNYNLELVNENLPKYSLKKIIFSTEYYLEKENYIEYSSSIPFPKKIEAMLSYNTFYTMKPLEYNIYRFPNNVSEENCTICLDAIEGECYKTSCNHYFHLSCISEFTKKYYTTIFYKALQNKSSSVEYDILGNVISGAPYEYSCPNCKKETFKLELVRKDNEIIVLNPENSIYKFG